MSEGGIRIVKMGENAPTKSRATRASRAVARVARKQAAFGILKGGKTVRKTPRFEAVADPAKSPKLKKTNRIRILTEKGAKTRRARIAEDAQKLPIQNIRATLRANRLPVKDTTSEKLVRKIYEDAQEAGMISS
jgi:hypothetical protein